jgi:hypothetical protein
MGKSLAMEEREGFRRVWNFVVPLHKLGNNNHFQSIPSLTKNSLKTTRKKSVS